jgi:hypothetical protein
MILFGTGHRPEDIQESEDEVRAKIRIALLELAPSTVISGMASGFDLWFGNEALDLGIETWAAKPWAGHTPRRGDESEYARIIEDASRVISVTKIVPYPGPWVYPVRNHWMVDNGNYGLAYWNGKESGGTYECLKYAQTKLRQVTNCYER